MSEEQLLKEAENQIKILNYLTKWYEYETKIVFNIFV
jgi:hypothetical protein